MGIYVIVDAELTPSPLSLVDDVLGAGVRLIQYRAKRGTDRALVRQMHERVRHFGALLVINDDVEAALDADGLHVGQEDLASLEPAAMRARLAGRVLGVSCSTAAEARAAAHIGADYLGVGPYNTTASKCDAGPAIGVAGIRAVVAATDVPVAAIGGIELGDLVSVAGAGAKMAAVISAIARGPDCAANARALVARWEELT